MPELPEVEVVRRGLADHVAGRRVSDLQLRGHRVARRHLAGPDDLVGAVVSRRIERACRRGKYLWLDLDGELGLVVHLGMSGQMLVAEPGSPDQRHLHARFTFEGGGPELRFVDQRTFGGLALSPLGADGVPESVAHIARDPFDPAFDAAAVARAAQRRESAIKRVLLDQRLVSGIGNIYADEALWRASVHGERPASRLTKPAIVRVLGHARDVMADSLAQGGTSFDALYVNVNGQSGSAGLFRAVYGLAGRPCKRCGTPIVREKFMNRSSHFCPVCQRKR